MCENFETYPSPVEFAFRLLIYNQAGEKFFEYNASVIMPNYSYAQRK